MSWAVWARRVRDPGLPVHRRASALRSLIELHMPFGFEGTERHLRRLVGVREQYDGRPVALRLDDWTDATLLAALDALEESRASRMRWAEVYAERRRREKAEHRRQPTRGDDEAMRRAEWTKDPEEAARRHPSRREVRRGAASAHDTPGAGA